MNKKNNPLAFTLVEILLSTVIIASVLISGFYALTFISIGKIRLIEKTKIEKEGFYFSEKLFEIIKEGGVLDFEEYFNRKMIGNTDFVNGHFSIESGYGNFGYNGLIHSTGYGNGLYYCISPEGSSMGTGGCVTANNLPSADYSGSHHRYGQYALQFIDYNSDYDNNAGDEDSDGDIRGDDDDKYIGQGPNVFDAGINITELYLISGDRLSRTLFRWTVQDDPNKPSSESCDYGTGQTPTGTGCLGTLEFLVLDGKDWGNNHDTSAIDADSSQYDGIIDTWIVNSGFAHNSNTIAGSNGEQYRESLFPDTMSVSDFAIFAYPNKDIDLAWKDGNNAINQSPYIKIKLVLSPSWKKRKTIKGKIPRVEIATTISLNDEFSQ